MGEKRKRDSGVFPSKCGDEPPNTHNSIHSQGRCWEASGGALNGEKECALWQHHALPPLLPLPLFGGLGDGNKSNKMKNVWLERDNMDIV